MPRVSPKTCTGLAPRARRPAGWNRWRRRVARELARGEQWRKAGELKRCGTWYKTECSHCGKPLEDTFYRYRCGIRWCPDCSRIAARGQRRALVDRVNLLKPRRGFRLRLLTLTLRYDRRRALDPARMRSDLELAWRGLAALWQAPTRGQAAAAPWRGLLHGESPWTGLAACAEIGARGGVHLHCLYWGPYIDQFSLSEAWRLATGSCVVDVREVEAGSQRALRKSLCEITKYLVAPKASSKLTARAIEAWDGLRSWRSWGMFFGVESEPDSDLMQCACVHCGSLMLPRIGSPLRRANVPDGQPAGFYNSA